MALGLPKEILDCIRRKAKLKANLSVGLPFDLTIYERDSFEVTRSIRIEAEDPIYHTISTGWSNALRDAFQSLPTYEI